MNETVELNLERTLSLFWSFIWRSFIGAVIAGVVLGFIGGFIVGAAGHPELGAAVGALLGYLGSIPVMIWALRAALLRKHTAYKVVLVKVDA